METKKVCSLTNHFFLIGLFVIMSCSEQIKTDVAVGKTINLKDPVELNWIGHWKGEGLKEQLVIDIAREFEFENQDIKVNLKFPEDVYYNAGNRGENSVENKFNAKNMLAEESEWDIIRLNHDSTLRVVLNDPKWAEKYFVDFSSIPEIHDALAPAVLTHSFKRSWSGILPGPPLDGCNYLLFCNTEVAKEIGIQVKQFDMTFDDFLGYIKAVHDYNVKNNKEIIGIVDNSDWSCLDIIPQQLFCSEIGDYDNILNENYSNAKEAAFRKVFASMEQLSRYKPLPGDISNHKWSTSGEVILNNKCLFYPQGSWMYNIWKSADSIKSKQIIPVQLPGYKKAVSYLGEYRISWAVPKSTPHKEEAVRLMKYLSKPETADKWVRYTKSPTGIKGSIVTTTMGFDDYENFDYTISSQFRNTKIARSSNTGFYLGQRNNGLALNFNGIIQNNPNEIEKLNSFLRNLRR